MVELLLLPVRSEGPCSLERLEGEGVKTALESRAGVAGLKAGRRVRRVPGGTGDGGVQEGRVWI